MKEQNSYFFEIIILPIIIIIFLVISITTYNIQITKEQIDKQIEDKKVEYLALQKKLVYNKVQFINSTIKVENTQIRQNLKKELSQRLEVSIKIINNIYNENKNLAKEEIYKKISNRLSFLRYNNNRAYYFILDKDDNVLLHPQKKFIGKNMKTFLDKNNESIVKNIRDSLKNEKIGFSEYYFYKPGIENEQFLKFVASTHFEPLDIVIGMGDYIDNRVKILKKSIIDKLEYDTDLDKYIFILDVLNIQGGDKFATMLVNNNRKDVVNKTVSDEVTDSKGKYYRKEYLKLIREKKEGFIKYWYKKPVSLEQKEKLTYLYFNKDWNWLIGSGFYLEDLDEDILKVKKESDEYLSNLISNSILWGVIFSIFTIIISTFIFYKLQKRINRDKEQLIQKESNLKKAQSISKTGSWDYDISSKVMNWSDEIYKILELKKDSFSPSYELFLSHVYYEDKDLVKTSFSNTIKKKNSHHFLHRVLVNNKIKWIENHSDIFFSKNINDYLILGTIQDITEKFNKDKKIEEQTQLLFHQSKMASMGEMIENIAHQWRQPLSAISISASALKVENEYKMLDSKKLDNGLDDILNSVKYLSNTIDDFREFFIKDKKKKICSINKLCKDSLKLLMSKFEKEDIKIINDNQEIECEVFENELIQCFMNIFGNAYDALVKNKIKQKVIFIKIYKEYDNVVIIIKDNAGGIDTKIINKVFEPYYTTKHKSQGTGIGLYMTQEIITKHLDGYIKVYNEEFVFENINYKGAAFKIAIPLNGIKE